MLRLSREIRCRSVLLGCVATFPLTGIPLDLPHSLAHETRSLLEKPVVLGARERVAARLIDVRMPDAIVNERRRQARAVAKKRGYTPSQAHLTLLAWNLFITNVPGTVWSPQTVCVVYSLRWQVEILFKSCKSDLYLATLTTTTKHSTLCYLYGRLGAHAGRFPARAWV